MESRTRIQLGVEQEITPILNRPDDDYENSLAPSIFGCDWEQLTTEMVLEKIKETNTCSNVDFPIEVWIDPEG